MASTYLSRTFGTATNRKKFTISLWFKKASNSSNQQFLDTGVDGNNQDGFKIHSSQALKFNGYESGTTYELQSNALLRDSSAWYNAVVSFDSTQSTSTNRLKMYLNGEQITSFSGATYPSLNFEPLMNKNTAHFIGSTFSNTNHFDGSMAMVEFVDGQQYGPEYFGSFNSASGIWTPSGATAISNYGTNGFKLKMDTTSPGADTSGKGNNFTASGTPTLTQGNPQNNWCTLNPVVFGGTSGQPVFSNGSTTASTTAGGWHPAFGSIGVTSGKWYFETKVIGYNHCVVGIANERGTYNTVTSGFPPSQLYSYGIVCYDLGKKETNNSRTAYGASSNITNGQIIGTAFDLDNNKLYWSVNGTFKNSGDPTSGATGTGAAYTLQTGETYFPMIIGNTSGGSNPAGGNLNFGEGFFGTTAAGTQADDNGQGLFAYDVPAGYYAMNTKNLEAYG